MKQADLVARMKELVPKVYEANAEFCRRSKIDPIPFEEEVGTGCTKKEIADLEKFLKVKLPPSYRAFLEAYGSWMGFSGTDLLGPKEHRSAHIKKTRADVSSLFDEFAVINPLKNGAIAIGLDARPVILLEPPVRKDGEMDVVEYDITEEEGRHPDLFALFESELRTLRGLLGPKKKSKKKAAKKKPEKPKPPRSSREAGRRAMEAGDGVKFLAALEGASDRADMLWFLGGAADDSRWDVRIGRSLLVAADFLLAQKEDRIRRFLPPLAIAASREHHYDAVSKRDAAAAVLEKMRPFVQRSEDAADLVARSGCHAWDKKERGQSRDLYALVKGCKLLKKNEWLRKLAKHHAKRK